MSHQALFSAVLSLEKPLLTSLTASSASSPIPTTIPAASSSSSSSSSSSKSTSKSKSKSSKSSKTSKSRRPSISSDSDSSFTHPPSSFTSRKRKYDDDQEVPGDTPLNKKLRRQQQNRQAAHTSRIKKKLQMDALQQQVTDLIAANRLLQEKVTALQSEVISNHTLLQETEVSTPKSHVSTPIIHDSPISTTESPESPISPIPITIKSPISPLSDSDASMDTSSSTSISLPPSQLTLPTSTSIIDIIPSSTRCYEPAVFELSPQCQQMENGMLSMIKQSPSPSLSTPTQSISPPLTWSQFTMILCILNTVWCMIQSSTTNTIRLKNIPLPTSLMKSLHQNPLIQVHNQTVNPLSIHPPLTSRMSGIESDINTNTNLMSNLFAMMVIMAMSRVTQQSITTSTVS